MTAVDRLEAARAACAEAGIPIAFLGRLAVDQDEAAELLRVSRSTVKRLVQRGELAVFRVAGATRIELTEVVDFIERNRVLKPDRRAERRARACALLDDVDA